MKGMQDQLKIKINIDGKPYTLNIPREKEEIFRRAEKEINRLIASIQSQYQAQREDYLAVIAMEFAVKALSFEARKTEDEASRELLELDRELGEYLNRLQ